jgi:hypothetical protein
MRRRADYPEGSRSYLNSSGGAPFFLFLNYMDAHEPYLPPPPFDTLYPGKDNREPTRLEIVGSCASTDTEPERNHLVSQHDGAIAYLTPAPTGRKQGLAAGKRW